MALERALCVFHMIHCQCIRRGVGEAVEICNYIARFHYIPYIALCGL